MIKKTERRLCILVLMLSWSISSIYSQNTDVKTTDVEAFKNPPNSAKPHTWWHWVNGNISKQGITKDLEALKEVGIGGIQMFNIDWATPFGDVEYNSPKSHDMFKHTFAEAERLGLEVAVNSSSGWSSTGGPWITPEHSMKMRLN